MKFLEYIEERDIKNIVGELTLKRKSISFSEIGGEREINSIAQCEGSVIDAKGRRQ